MQPHGSSKVRGTTILSGDIAAYITFSSYERQSCRKSLAARLRSLMGASAWCNCGVYSTYLTANPIFAGISPAALAVLDATVQSVSVAGGKVLFEQGDPTDALYLLVRGTLHIVIRDSDGGEQSIEYLGAGALVGELGVMLGEPRTATVRAVRDAELIRIPRETFLQLLETEPALGAAVSRLLSQRLKRTTKHPRVRLKVQTVALVPVNQRPVPGEFVQSLLEALARQHVSARHLSSATVDRDVGAGASAIARGEAGDSQLLELCDAIERDHALVIYETDPIQNAWTERCLRRADLVLLVTEATDASPPGELEKWAVEGRSTSAVALVLLHNADQAPRGTIEWLRHRSGLAHHHVHPERAESCDRLVRFVTGTARGLVLSGGGARGFAHLGVMKALREAAIPIDVIGGASMGAIIAAQYAAGFDVDAMVELNRRSFSGSDVSDLTVPTVALRKARSTVRRLRSMFGERQIEDLPMRFFCTTSDLTHARVCVHDRGPVWLWTRASCSIPGLAPPIVSGRSLLVDGGLLNNLPADIMRQRCSGAVIAVNVTPTVDLTTDAPLVAEMSGWPHLWRMMFAGAAEHPFPNIAQILSRTVLIGSVHGAQDQVRHSDLYLDPALEGIGMGSFDAIDRVVEEGYRHAVTRIAAWQSQTGDHAPLS